jgi:bacillithiol biosynthesis deacetylase BshB1
MTEGELSTNGDLKTRSEETGRASEILKLDMRLNLNLGDCSVGRSSENTLKVINVLREHRPAVVLVPYFRDRHPDHENTNRLVRESVFFSGLIKYPAAGKPHRPYAVLSYMLSYQFDPDFITDISDFYHLKMKACRAYASQFYGSGNEISGPGRNENFPQNLPTFINTKHFRNIIYSRDKCYGIKIRVKFGEPYLIEDKIEIDDPVNFFRYLI